jgi:thiaminase (transcriptional activator TenA)
MFHQALWRENMDTAFECLRHPFVKGLGDGSLDRGSFRRYVAQDAFFLRAFAAAYAVTAGKSADNLPRMQTLHALMGGAMEELKLHAEYGRELGIDLDSVRPYAATSAYRDFLLRTAWHEPVGVALAAMAPCMRLYAFLGRNLADAHVPLLADHPYRKWIETYASDEFEALAREVERLVDETAEDSPAVRGAYRYAMECERAFFSAALEA